MANFHSINGNEVEAHYAGGDLREEIDNKADSDGYYAMLTAGAADNLTARGDGVTASFLHRTTAGSASVPDEGTATVRSIKGRSLGWNQLISCSDSTSTKNDITATASATSDTVTLSGNWAGATSADRNFYGLFNTHSLSVVSGHKYLMHCTSSNATLVFYGTGISGTSAPEYGSYIWTAAASGAASLSLKMRNNPSAVTISETVRSGVFDLTAMFGAGNEPATVDEFEALFPEPYYEYDAGSLLPVNMEGIETVGFNQWDEEWENGYYSRDTGAKGGNSNTTYIRSKNYIPCFPNTDYHVLMPTKHADNNSYFAVLLYDADHNYLYHEMIPLIPSRVFTTPKNASYMTFYAEIGTTGATYQNDICINLSWSGYRNGEYEPYWSEQRTISAIAENFPDGMRSAGSVYDELTSTEAIHRVGAVDLGTLDWSIISSADTHIWRARINSLPDGAAALPVNTMNAADAMIAGYEVKAFSPLSASDDKRFAIGPAGDGTRLIIIDTAYSTAEAFAASLNGKKMHYALATPTTTTFDTPINMDYRFADFGTERILVPEGQMSAPPTMEVAYGYTAASLLDAAASALADPDGPKATTNHAAGSYLTMGGTLYRVTNAIAAGEAIVPGTNVVATTVMAEILSLIQ